jgi:hypothetical protein
LTAKNKFPFETLPATQFADGGFLKETPQFDVYRDSLPKDSS